MNRTPLTNWALVAWLILATGTCCVQAQTAPRPYQTRNFDLVTDLSPQQSKQLGGRLESLLQVAMKYWGSPCRRKIECYIAQNVGSWPPTIGKEAGRAAIANNSSTALTTTYISSGGGAVKTHVYSIPDLERIAPLVVRAYCRQTFGTRGPAWYARGIDQIAVGWTKSSAGVHVEDSFLANVLANRQAIIETTGSDNPRFSSSWALCYFMMHNPNYAPQFRKFGLSLLVNGDGNFEAAFAKVLKRLEFEYNFFLDHVEIGYRVDLTAWDWDRKFAGLVSDRKPLAANVQAARGWQPTGLKVTAGRAYTVECRGTWNIDAKTKLTADGTDGGLGRIQAVLLRDGSLGEPFALGANGMLVPPGSGDLYVRCFKPWNQLADNKGRITLKLGLSGQSGPSTAAGFTSMPVAQAPAATPKVLRKIRTWTAAAGGFTVKAKLAEVTGDAVILQRELDGKKITVPLSKLSKADLDYVRAAVRAP